MDDAAFLQHYRGLVVVIAKKLAERYRLQPHMDEMVAFGEQGLLEARGRFDDGRGNKFSTFAHYRIKGAILDGCRVMGWTQRRRRRKMVSELRFTEHQWSRYEDAPEPAVGLEGLAVELDEMVSDAAIVYLMTDEDAARIPDRSSLGVSPEEKAARKERASIVRGCLEALDDTDRAILTLTFFEERSLEEIGEHIGCSRSWACRQRRGALKRFKSLYLERVQDRARGPDPRARHG